MCKDMKWDILIKQEKKVNLPETWWGIRGRPPSPGTSWTLLAWCPSGRSSTRRCCRKTSRQRSRSIKNPDDRKLCEISTRRKIRQKSCKSKCKTKLMFLERKTTYPAQLSGNKIGTDFACFEPFYHSKVIQRGKDHWTQRVILKSPSKINNLCSF